MSPRKTKEVGCAAFEVPVKELRLQCDPACLGFQSTADIEPLEDHAFIHQQRAENAIETGFSVPGHLFIVTPDGAITSVLLARAQKEAAKHAPPEIHDILYVYNRTQPDKPKKISLPKGKGISFAMSVKKLRDTLRGAIPRTLSSEDCLKKRQSILEKFKIKMEAEQEKFSSEIRGAEFDAKGIGNVRFFIAIDQRGNYVFDDFGTPVINGWVMQKGFLPGHEDDGEEKKQDRWCPYWQVEGFANLSDEQKDAISSPIDTMVQGFKVRYFQMMAELNVLHEQSIKEVLEARSEFIDMTFRREAAEILKEYDVPVFGFVDSLREYTIENVERAFLLEGTDENHPGHSPHSQVVSLGPDPLLPFEVNVFVDNSHTEGAPIIDDRNPTYDRLFGEIVFIPTAKGPHSSDHTMIRAGDLSRAEGGYLILPARALLTDTSIWSRLRAVLESKRLDIGVGTWRTITPEPLPVNVRLILVGDRFAYAVLNSHPWLREDFDELFKVVAEFDREIPLTAETIRQFAQLIKLFQRRGDLPDVSSDGVARILEYSCRQVGNKAKFLLDARSIKETLHEAGHLARKENPQAAVITGEHVACALQKRVYRADLIREKIHELIRDGVLLTRLQGKEVGQINSLVVFSTGNLIFGIPKRITVRTYAGEKGIINIEREVRLSGQIHDKGVFIFGGYLGGKYAQEHPLSFSASISFEQEYAGVEGDSASSTELYAILSSLAGLPLRQDVAVTGSVNQFGEIQPIGGVNEKIEGFFDVLKLMNITGNPGVLIPYQNIQNLMLRDDVARAVASGTFKIYAVKTVDEGMEILTGVTAGKKVTSRWHKGQYQKGSVNWRVAKRLVELQRAVGQK